LIKQKSLSNLFNEIAHFEAKLQTIALQLSLMCYIGILTLFQLRREVMLSMLRRDLMDKFAIAQCFQHIERYEREFTEIEAGKPINTLIIFVQKKEICKITCFTFFKMT
jgi:hypothetical protein